MKFLSCGVALGIGSVYVAGAHDTRNTPTKREQPQSHQHKAREQHQNHDHDSRTTPHVDAKTAQREHKHHHSDAREEDGRPSQIVGGSQSNVGEYPYYVDMNGCGASLIAPGVVLSAAHCMPGGFSYVGQSVIIGGYDRGQITKGAVQATVTETLFHPSYNAFTGMSYDFMLLKLDSPVIASGPGNLSLNSKSSRPAVGQTLTVIGNGLTQEGGTQSDILLETDVPTISTEVCNGPYAGAVENEVMFCAGGTGKDSCQGDSGGPIVVKNGNTHTQVGVVSWGYGCAQQGFPGVYARVSTVMNWIAHVTCTCWGVNDAYICSHLDSDDNFSCKDASGGSDAYEDASGGGDGYEDASGGNGGGNSTGCEIISGWTDGFEDGCKWFEENDWEGCPLYGAIEGTKGATAWDACCHCDVNKINENGASGMVSKLVVSTVTGLVSIMLALSFAS